MKALETFYTAHAFTGDTPAISATAKRLHLCQLFADLGYTKGAEIGVWTGTFSQTMCRSIPGLHLTCVDPWAAYADYRGETKNNQKRLNAAYEEALERLKPFDCRVLRMTSADAAALVPDGSLDYVYVDANHGYLFVLNDLERWAPKVRSGGIIAGHDYEPVMRNTFIKVKPAVDKFTADHRVSPWYVLAGEKSPSYFWVQA